jgi:hypothetical protein
MLIMVAFQLPCQAKKQALDFVDASKLSDDDLKQLQYYSNGFYLMRVVSSTGEHHASGTLVMKDGQATEIVTIKRGTPGVATAVARSARSISIWVSFEPGCSIEFRAEPDYQKMPFIVQGDNGVEYCGFKYQAFESGSSHPSRLSFVSRMKDQFPFLLTVDQERFEEAATKRRVAPGRRVGEK